MVEYMIVTKCWWKKLLEEIKCKLTSFYPETSSCHSEPFDGLPETTLGTGRTGSSKNLCGPSDYEILRRPAIGGTPQNDIQEHGFRMDTNECSSRNGSSLR
jgi:hypothetical protein